MLYPASAYLPSGNILGFTTLSGPGTMTIPTSSSLSSIPSPLLAGLPAAASQQLASQLSSVQAPLLAAGEDAGRGGGGTMLAAYGGYALPGLLVVLATAIVGAVGAGNIRVWQSRLAARSGGSASSTAA
jgi:hypothetical protein